MKPLKFGLIIFLLCFSINALAVRYTVTIYNDTNKRLYLNEISPAAEAWSAIPFRTIEPKRIVSLKTPEFPALPKDGTFEFVLDYWGYYNYPTRFRLVLNPDGGRINPTYMTLSCVAKVKTSHLFHTIDAYIEE